MAINLSTLLNTSSAWVNFNGTGTPAIRSSYNVSSITKSGTGDYTVNFTTPMADANYSTNATNGNSYYFANVGTQTQNNVQINSYNPTPNLGGYVQSASLIDSSVMCVSIFGN